MACKRRVVRSMFTDGEAFARFRIADGPMPLRLQMIAPDQVDPTVHRDLDGGRRIRSGIELDADGRRLAYHVLPSRPGDMLPASWTPVRVPAEDMLQVFEAYDLGQVRGLSMLAPVLSRIQEMDAWEDAELVKQKIAASLTAFVVDPEGNSAEIFGTDAVQKRQGSRRGP